MQLATSIQIKASAEEVWKVLLDFQTYPSWNPFIQSISGAPEVGSRLNALIQNMRFKPIVLIANPNSEFRWLGKLGLKGIFDGEHYFKIETLQNGTCILHQGEIFRGILVPFFKNKLKKETQAGFIEMNEALKKRVESMR